MFHRSTQTALPDESSSPWKSRYKYEPFLRRDYSTNIYVAAKHMLWVVPAAGSVCSLSGIDGRGRSGLRVLAVLFIHNASFSEDQTGGVAPQCIGRLSSVLPLKPIRRCWRFVLVCLLWCCWFDFSLPWYLKQLVWPCVRSHGATGGGQLDARTPTPPPATLPYLSDPVVLNEQTHLPSINLCQFTVLSCISSPFMALKAEGGRTAISFISAACWNWMAGSEECSSLCHCYILAYQTDLLWIRNRPLNRFSSDAALV